MPPKQSGDRCCIVCVNWTLRHTDSAAVDVLVYDELTRFLGRKLGSVVVGKHCLDRFPPHLFFEQITLVEEDDEWSLVKVFNVDHLIK